MIRRSWYFLRPASGRQANKVCMKIGFDGLIRSEAVGFSGGIWHRDRVSLVDVDAHDQVILFKVNGVGLSEWILSAIYASPNPTCREELWSRLLNFSASNNLPWMMIGDFNETRCLEERTGSSDHSEDDVLASTIG
ncbi:LOW QUALITY PROTEIN: hypothetical protein V2J09_010036 [Rumex salicifolius]